MSYTDEPPSRADEVRKACTRTLSGWGRGSLQDEVAAFADEAARGGDRDVYGSGGVVGEVEESVRSLLGAEAAVLCPSGTLAQQVALRHWCARSPRVAMHRTAHPLHHEDDALATVQGLAPVVVGERVELEAVQRVHGEAPLGAVFVELPYRETGGQLTSYDELAALSSWCRENGVALHVDGARLWECGPAYAPRSLADVAALADSVYVSLYKGMGAPSGAVLVGPADLAETARLWRHRLGGTLYGLWPIALAARRGLRDLLPQVPAWLAHAVALADALEAAGLEVVHRPQIPFLRVVLPAEPDVALAAVLPVAERSGVWLGKPFAGSRPGTSLVEVSVQEPSLAVPPAEGAALLVEAVAAMTEGAA